MNSEAQRLATQYSVKYWNEYQPGTSPVPLFRQFVTREHCRIFNEYHTKRNPADLTIFEMNRLHDQVTSTTFLIPFEEAPEETKEFHARFTEQFLIFLNISGRRVGVITFYVDEDGNPGTVAADDLPSQLTRVELRKNRRKQNARK